MNTSAKDVLTSSWWLCFCSDGNLLFSKELLPAFSETRYGPFGLPKLAR
jgi:hypothetical protein